MLLLADIVCIYLSKGPYMIDLCYLALQKNRKLLEIVEIKIHEVRVASSKFSFYTLACVNSNYQEKLKEFELLGVGVI